MGELPRELPQADPGDALTHIVKARSIWSQAQKEPRSVTSSGGTRVQRLLQTVGVRRRWVVVPRRPETGWDALTGMERCVALLIADGCTNRSAAEQLVLCSSTISTHLRAVFRKLGVHSRVQLANSFQRQDS
jgi:DNA-binding NarL/FixJ family response regulator